MKRQDCIAKLNDIPIFDIVVIGGGATGLGAALDAVSRGYKTLLLEQADFASGTSSRSTKLIHGGVRYLRQGNMALVHEGLSEREILLRNAPHLVHELPFIIPTQNNIERLYYSFGLKLYDALRGKSSFSASKGLNKADALRYAPNLNTRKFSSAVYYSDGQFDDARLALELAQTVNQLGGIALNHLKVHGIEKRQDDLQEITAFDLQDGNTFKIKSRALINATGIFSLDFQTGNTRRHNRKLIMSRGTHLVFEKRFLDGKAAIMLPKTDDGRVIFAIPWYGHMLVGTTDIVQKKPTMCPAPTAEEIDYLLRLIGPVLNIAPAAKDILCAFTGIRPLAGQQGHTNTAKISREHAISHDALGTVCITGGKWTSYRRMGKDVIDYVIKLKRWSVIPSQSKNLRIHNYAIQPRGKFARYGMAASALEQLDQTESQPLQHTSLPISTAQIRYAIREEMALTLEDVLARRTRCLFLNVRETLKIAPRVVEIMAEEMQQGKDWANEQLEIFGRFAQTFLPPGIK